MKNAIGQILLAIVALGASEAAFAQNFCADAFSGHRTSVAVEGPDIEEHRELLTHATHEILRFYEKDFVAPTAVTYSDYGQAPMYRDGYINARFPFYLRFSFGELMKSAADSLAINLHELGHQIFETTRMASVDVAPEVNWAFGAKIDMLGKELSLERIEKTKASTRYKGQSTEAILEHFATYSSIATAYEELFADTIPVLFYHDPLAIYKSIRFKEADAQGDEFDHASQKSAELRRFDVEPAMSQVIAESQDDAHGTLAPVRAMVWREFNNSGLSGSAMAKLIYRAILLSMQSVTKNFTRPASEIGAVELNADLKKQVGLLLSNVKRIPSR